MDTYVTYTYDALNRVTRQRHVNSEDKTVLYRNIAYKSNSNRVATVRNDVVYGSYDVTYTYTYDENGNISSVNDGTYVTVYTYDKANQLVREDNEKAGKSWYWTYNTAGNLWVTKEFEYTTGILGPATKTITNFYADYNSVWKDQLWTRDGVQFTYDGVGNTLYDGEWNYTWERGRQLKSMSKSGATWNFTYDADGLRTKRTDGSNTYLYYYDGGLLRCMEYNGVKMFFTYDAQGMPVSMTYNGATYYYALNLQGDVMAILNASSAAVVNYNYNAWGELLSTTGSLANTIGLYNPLRYRGYVYDRETGLYYLQSRYYNPEICRFISPDDVSLIGANDAVISHNLYAYCSNNPVSRADDGGHFWHIVIGAAVGAVIGAVSSIVAQAVSGNEINWGEVGVSAASGAVSGAITTAVPGMGAIATGLTQGTVGAATHVATELVNGRTPTLAGTLAAGITSGVLAGGIKAIGNAVSSGKIEIGRIKGVRASEGYPGIRYKTDAGPAYSVELHGSHNGHTPHIQVNKWLYQRKGYVGQPYRHRSWHFEFLKFWKGFY